MSKAQATAEHWEVVSAGECPIGVGRRTGKSTTYEMLCNPILTGKGPSDMPEINRVMTLMAAAPDLLAACKLLVHNEAKADEVRGLVDNPHVKALRASAEAARAAISKAQESP